MVYYNFIKPGQESYYPSILGSLDVIIFYSIDDYINSDGDIPLVDTIEQALITQDNFLIAQYLRVETFPDGTLMTADEINLGFQVHALLKKLKLKRYYDVRLKEIFSSLDTERETWERQKIEADAYTLDVNAVTPFLDTLSTARGITKADLVSKVLLKAELYVLAVANMLGEQHKNEDALALCLTLADLDLLVLPDFCTLNIDLELPVVETTVEATA